MSNTITRPTTTVIDQPGLAEAATAVVADPTIDRNERGLATAEYAAGTVGVLGIVTVIFKLFQSTWFQELVKALIEAAFSGFGL